MLVIRSKYQCGFRRDGGVLLKQGDNEIDEEVLTSSEKAFIAALAKAGIVTVDPFPDVMPKVASVPAPVPANDEPVALPVPEPESAPVVVEESRRKKKTVRKAS